jgi:hypothetical protein
LAGVSLRARKLGQFDRRRSVFEPRFETRIFVRNAQTTVAGSAEKYYWSEVQETDS